MTLGKKKTTSKKKTTKTTRKTRQTGEANETDTADTVQPEVPAEPAALASETTTSAKRPRRTTKTTTRRKAPRKKSAATATQLPTGETAPRGFVPELEPALPGEPAARHGETPAGQPALAVASPAEDAAIAEPPAEPADRGPQSGPEVLRSGEAIVIRFPPVAPLPFAPIATGAPSQPPTLRAAPPQPARPAPPVTEDRTEVPEPAAAEEAQAGVDEVAPEPARGGPAAEPETEQDRKRGRRRRRRGRSGDRAEPGRGDQRADRRTGERRYDDRRVGDRQPPDASRLAGERAPTPPAGPREPRPAREFPEMSDEEYARLSPSKKRRLRRQRRNRMPREQGPALPRPDRGPADEAELDSLAPAVDEGAPLIPDESLNGDHEPFTVLAENGNGSAEDTSELLETLDEEVTVEEPAEELDDEEAIEIVPTDELETGEQAAEVESVSLAETEAPAELDDREYEEIEDREQRRGRWVGRRRRRGGRAPIEVTPDAEALEVAPEAAPAGRPAKPTKEMVINVVPREECRIAILHQGKLEEMYIERASAENHVGNIYKGVVTNVEPSIQAAFVDFGLGKNGFLHISDLHPQYFPDGGGQAENVGRKMPRKNRPPIQRCLRRGQQVIVQITKEGIGTKGPTLSTYLSIPGRFLVMMPGMRRLGVSRKIEDEPTRINLRDALNELELPDGMGFIARTAASGRSKEELQSDLRYLTRLWGAVKRRIKEERPPAELYRESDLVIRTIRDVFSHDIGRIVVDEPGVAARAREFLEIFSPEMANLVVEYSEAEPVFHKYGIEAELDRLHSRHVPLRSGGSLVIDQTEALVAIDVNSGRFRTEDDAETTAFKINLEAADEIARQLRLRDLGGVIICDFIDMRQESHKRQIERGLARALKQHKERAKILRMSQFGIIEMTRQRQRASLTRSVYQDCHHCRGTGLVKTAESVALDVMRTIQLNVIREQIRLIEITISSEVANLLLNRKRGPLHEMETRHRRSILIRPDPNFGLDQVEVRCYDQRGRPVPQA